jgi:hypothetical protein
MPSQPKKLIPAMHDERPGYEIPSPIGRRSAYAVSGAGEDAAGRIDFDPWWKKTHTESCFGLLILAVGLYWSSTVEALTPTFETFSYLLIHRNPMKVFALGFVLWLHAKWRRSVRVA